MWCPARNGGRCALVAAVLAVLAVGSKSRNIPKEAVAEGVAQQAPRNSPSFSSGEEGDVPATSGAMADPLLRRLLKKQAKAANGAAKNSLASGVATSEWFNLSSGGTGTAHQWSATAANRSNTTVARLVPVTGFAEHRKQPKLTQ